MVNWGADVVEFGAQSVSFGMLVAPNLAPWGPSSDAGGLGSTQKETLGVQAWISIDLGRISGPPFRRFSVPWGPFWHRLGTIERCRGTWEHTEGDLGGPSLDFYRFGEDFGAAIFAFLVNSGTKMKFFGMRVCRSRFLKILGSESVCLGLQNQAFRVGSIAKTSFSHMTGLC